MKKTIIIMCKSIKHYPNYCVAGIDVETGEWIRPISNRDDLEGAVLVKDTKYQDGNEVEIFDVVEIEMIKACPNDAQKENYLYDSEYHWKKVGESSLQNILNSCGCDDVDFIFSDDQKAINDSRLDGTSLLLVKIQNPAIWVKRYPERLAITFSFTYCNHHYSFIPVSDIALFEEFKKMTDGKYYLEDEMFAVFSLTGQYKDGQYYKMLAQLF